MPSTALGAPRFAALQKQHRRNRGGGGGGVLRPSALTLPTSSSPSDNNDPEDYSSLSERPLFLDEDDYELSDEELDGKMPSSTSSSSPSSSLAISSLAAAARTRLGRGARRLRARARRATADLPDDLLGRALWLWESRPVARARLAVSVAAAGARAPALVALVASQAGGVVASTQLSLPVVAPLLIGLPVLARSVAANASAVAPRAAAAALLLWLAWFCNKVATSTALYLRRQGALDARIAGAVVACSEVLALSAASLVMLSALGVNVSALLFPAAALAGWAAADGARCFGAGAFLFAAQPFRLGDRVAVRAPPGGVPLGLSSNAPPPYLRNLGGRDGNASSSFATGNSNGGSNGAFFGEEEQEAAAAERERASATSPSSSSWFDGHVLEVNLRYTVLRRGNARLFLPNSSFLTKEFLVFDQERVQPQQQPQQQPVSMSSSMAAAARRRRAAAASQQQQRRRDAGTQMAAASRGGVVAASASAAAPPSSYPLPPPPPPPQQQQQQPQSAGWSNYAPGAWNPQQQEAQALWQQQQQGPPPPPSQPPPPSPSPSQPQPLQDR